MKAKNKLNLKQIRTKNILGYFRKNNIGFDDSFVHNYARLRIYKVFDYYDIHKDKRLDFSYLIIDLKRNYKYLKFCCNKAYLEEKEYYPEELNYNFENIDLETIKSEMYYISDRWNCYHRLKWILDLLDKKLIKIKE